MSGSVFYAKIHHMKDIIILMGGQGVGKGTFARMLRERHDYKYIETGNILRESAKTNKKAAIIQFTLNNCSRTTLCCAFDPRT